MGGGSSTYLPQVLNLSRRTLWLGWSAFHCKINTAKENCDNYWKVIRFARKSCAIQLHKVEAPKAPAQGRSVHGKHFPPGPTQIAGPCSACNQPLEFRRALPPDYWYSQVAVGWQYEIG